MANDLQDRIMDWLFDLQIAEVIYISNMDEASVIGEQIWKILKQKQVF